jgi:microcystin-dependent protein
MGEPFIGEIRMFGGTFAPAGWAFCNGATMPISENDTLFTLIGTTYGGDGQETFQLPDLQGRVPMHAGTGKDGITYTIGEKGGVESVTINTNQLPTHTHPMLGSGDIANSANPGNSVVARSPQVNAFLNATPTNQMSPQSVSPDGGSQPHENLQPYLCISFIISLFGVFPAQT